MSFSVNNMERLDIKKHEFVLDIIGFPADNTMEYDLEHFGYDNPPVGYFCRDWLSDTFGNLAM